MAHGLEIRVPYLDPVVAEFAARCRCGARLRGLTDQARAARGGRAAAARPHRPRAQARLLAPAAAWLRGPLRPLAAELLAPATLRRQGLVDPAAVAALLDRHVQRREDLSRAVCGR